VAESEAAKPVRNQGRATIVFLVVVGGVVALFAYLSSLGGAPPMKPLPQHTLRFDTAGGLVGLMSDPEAAQGPQPPVHGLALKEVEKAVNQTCQQCHGAFPGFTGKDGTQPPFDPKTHPCSSGAAPCLPDHHPPKTECIKCHRAGPR
jgi:hypothetical protein